ncbi:MAG: hypothetical protein A4S09_04185 [Proteobacteria bacterium SG_bin7]|nr:MAG: hypothetical protein A4S09_04185 [Proteobacteria bacterium SG_bin7]
MVSTRILAFESPQMKISSGVSLVSVISAKESVMFAGAALESVWKEARLNTGLKYLRTVMMGNSVGTFSVTNVNLGYLISAGKTSADRYFGIGVDYQIGGFNFGQIPMVGARLFAGGAFLVSESSYFWESSISGAYSAVASVYEIQNNWRCDASLGTTIFDNVLAIVGLDYRDFSYRTPETTGGYSSMSLLALSIGLGLTY